MSDQSTAAAYEKLMSCGHAARYMTGSSPMASDLICALCELDKLRSRQPGAAPSTAPTGVPWLHHLPRCGETPNSIADSLAGRPWLATKDKWQDCTCGLADFVMMRLAARVTPAPPVAPTEEMCVFTGTGDGGRTWLVPVAKMLQEFHDQHCDAQHDWQLCDTEGVLGMTRDVANEENWSKDYPDYTPHVYTLHGEDYSLTIARIAASPGQEGK